MIVVTGATGAIGRALVARLRGHDVLAVVRRPADDLGCPYTLADFDEPESIGRLLSPGDRLFLNSSLWPGVVDAQRAVIDLAARAGVARVVAVSVRHAAPGARLGMGMHGLIDAHLRASGLPWSILQPSGFMQNLPRDFGDGVMYGSYGSAPVNYIDTRDIADAAAALLTGRAGAAGATGAADVAGAAAPGRDHLLTGPASLSHERIAEEVGAFLGHPLRYVDLPVPEMAAHLERQGLPGPQAEDLARLMAEMGDGSWAEVTSEVRDLTGHPPRPLSAFLADHASAFRR
ncbi:NAD(P)H-binding protein [Nonomuraea candida]|uniref:NAD(P)H-binding protein n=1 Tax=Nonomuraea candida TaxID=359159 RepID=UPI0005BAF243|nr:NAD(P)H-binding protein [Nonomuraea candida]